MKHLLFIISILLMGCVSSGKYKVTAEEENLIEECTTIRPHACVELGLMYAKQRDYASADLITRKACEEGYKVACELNGDLPGMQARYEERMASKGRMDANLINLFQQSANQMGTIGGVTAGQARPRPNPVRCVTKWDMFAQGNVTVCE